MASALIVLRNISQWNIGLTTNICDTIDTKKPVLNALAGLFKLPDAFAA
jgi:hypothetical protein